MARYKIRERERIDSSPKDGLRQSWTEFQVVRGNTIMGRFGCMADAKDRKDALDAIDRQMA